MPKLAIIDQDSSTGGGLRFAQWLVQGMVSLANETGWEITVVTRRQKSVGGDAGWSKFVKGDRARLIYLRDDWLRRTLDKLSRGGRIMGIPGTSRLQQLLPGLMRKYGNAPLRELAGESGLWIEEFCRQEKFDVLYFPIPYFMACPDLTIPMVCTPHDFNYKTNFSLGDYAKKIEEQMGGWLERCAALVVSSQFIADEFATYHPEYASKVKVVLCGIPGSNHLVTDAQLIEARERLSLPAEFLLVSGWMFPHKNQKVVFEALGRLRKRGVNIPLVLTGANSHHVNNDYRGWLSPYISEIRDTASALGLKSGEDYRGMGYLEEADLDCVFKLARALIVPSIYEAGSFPLLEAARARCPIVCSKIAPIEEQVAHLEGNAWMFAATDPDDLAAVIEQMLNDREGAKAKVEGAADLVAKVYSWESAARNYLSIFEELVH